MSRSALYISSEARFFSKNVMLSCTVSSKDSNQAKIMQRKSLFFFKKFKNRYCCTFTFCFLNFFRWRKVRRRHAIYGSTQHWIVRRMMYCTQLHDKNSTFRVRRCVKNFEVSPQAYFEKNWKTNCILHYNPTMVYQHTKFQNFWKKSGELGPCNARSSQIMPLKEWAFEAFCVSKRKRATVHFDVAWKMTWSCNVRVISSLNFS